MPREWNTDHLSPNHPFRGCRSEADCLQVMKDMVTDGDAIVSGSAIYVREGKSPVDTTGRGTIPGFRPIYTNDLRDWVGGNAGMQELRSFATQQQNGHSR